MMMSNGSTPKMPIVTKAGAVSSQRLIVARFSILAVAAWAEESGVE